MLTKSETLFVLGYMLLPLLALLSAVVGLLMILGGDKILGAIVLVVVTQAFAFGAYFALKRRKAAVLEEQATPEQ
ncbi:NF038396 family protein [Arthrobacter sp. M4]|uniref:NF038396 family protein n=1 Tax=Arthrobacter sp. M4 TaxID=218160 RepID=UPI001CDBE61E|nr:NF038396 family protein [Arthrobacter sp. M4]MCA4132882.1 NF038396 family protein [Arthrobacter sp. M4]